MITKLLKSKGLEIYRLTSISTDKDFVIVDNNCSKILYELNLLKVYDYIINELPKELLIFINENNKSLFEKATSKECLKEFIINGKKMGYFNLFKNELLSEVERVYSMDFMPINQRIIEKDNTKYLNIYFPNNKYRNIIPKVNDNFKHLKKIMFNLMGNNQEIYNKWMNYLAFKIQFPEKQIPTHWVIIDNGGTGKTTFLGNDILDNIFNTRIIGQNELEESYTHYLKNQQFIVCEEIESFKNMKKLKMLTGSKTFAIRELYKNPYNITNYCSFILFSNDIKALYIDEHERRFNIVGGGKRLFALNGNWEKCLFKSKAENEEFFKTYHKNFKEEIKSLYSHLKAVKVDESDILHTIETEQKKDLLEITRNPVDSFVNEILETDLNSVIDRFLPNYSSKFTDNILYDSELKKFHIINQNLYYLFCEFCKKTNHRPIQSNNFYKRLWKNENVNQIFTESKQMRYKTKRHIIYVIQKEMYKDDNKSI